MVSKIASRSNRSFDNKRSNSEILVLISMVLLELDIFEISYNIKFYFFEKVKFYLIRKAFMDSYKKEGVLLIQLGSPKSSGRDDVKEYLLSFLGDSHTVGAPPFIWKPLLRYFIAPSRAAKSALKYQEMCETQGVEEMPLITYTRQFAEGVQAELHKIGRAHV